MQHWKILAVLGPVILAACGGGYDTTMAGIDGGGSPAPSATIVSHGRISGFGSVIVNGVHYDTSGAEFLTDGVPGTESDLAVGQVVTVYGTINGDSVSGTADSVTFDDAVEGPISAIDLGNNTMTVLGQTVIVTLDTSFDDDISPKDLEGLSVGNVVEVSGYFNSSGNIVATRIELESPAGEFEVTGIVSNVDAGNRTFEIGALIIDYSQVTILDDFPAGMPEDGQLVEAKGDTLTGPNELRATSLELEDDRFDFDNADDVEIEGLITRFASATDFDVAGQPITTNSGTRFDDGTIDDLALDVRVEVEGSVDASGVLVAEQVDFEKEGVLRVTTNVEAVQDNSLTLLGIEITVDDKTEFEDDSDLDIDTFGIADIAVGDYLEVRGSDGSGSFIATRVERDDDEDRVELRGFATDIGNPNFVILGVTIETNGQTEFADGDLTISAAEFFAQADGRLVDVDGTFSNGRLVADEVEFED